MKKEVYLIKMSKTEERLIIFHRLGAMSHILIFRCLKLPSAQLRAAATLRAVSPSHFRWASQPSAHSGFSDIAEEGISRTRPLLDTHIPREEPILPVNSTAKGAGGVDLWAKT